MLFISLRVLLSAAKSLSLVVRNVKLKGRQMFGNLTMLWEIKRVG
jgi:hypothetical protein